MSRWSAADPALGAHDRTRGPTTELIEDVGRGHDPHELSVIEDGQAADRAASHQIRRLAEGGRRIGDHDVPGHELSDRSAPTYNDAPTPAEVAFRQDAHDVLAIHDDEVTDALRPHQGPGILGLFAGP